MMHKEIMIRAARAAGEIQRAAFGKTIAHEHKKDLSIATQADKDSENEIVRILTQNYPYTIIAEESGITQTDSEFAWVIDPIDGTHNFARGIPVFGVSIGLTKNGIPVEGVIYHPMQDELFYAAQGQGCELNGKALVLQDRMNTRDYIGFEPNIGAMPMHEWGKMYATLRDGAARDVRVWGACVFGFSQAARGNEDAYIANGQHDWDFAAGVIICQETGCMVTDWQGNPWRLGEKSLLVSRKELYDELLAIVNKK